MSKQAKQPLNYSTCLHIFGSSNLTTQMDRIMTKMESGDSLGGHLALFKV